MRVIFAIVGGFVFTVAVFVSGIAVAIWVLAAKPVQQAELSQDVTDLWTREPRTVRTPVEGLERIPARQADADVNETPDLPAADAVRAAESGLDGHETGAVESEALEGQRYQPLEPRAAEPGTVEATAEDTELLDATATGSINGEDQPTSPGNLSAAHVDWCASRYRSYRVADNSYAPYSGGRRNCVSPYLGSAEGEPEFAVVADEGVDAFEAQPADEFEGGLNSAQVEVTSEHMEYCFSRYRSYRPEDNTYQPYGGGPRQQCR